MSNSIFQYNVGPILHLSALLFNLLDIRRKYSMNKNLECSLVCIDIHV